MWKEASGALLTCARNPELTLELTYSEIVLRSAREKLNPLVQVPMPKGAKGFSVAIQDRAGIRFEHSLKIRSEDNHQPSSHGVKEERKLSSTWNDWENGCQYYNNVCSSEKQWNSPILTLLGFQSVTGDVCNEKVVASHVQKDAMRAVGNFLMNKAVADALLKNNDLLGPIATFVPKYI